ncbi:MAG: Asp23/Gls24 family envelope stress response protein [Gaiellaceae bacterium]|nr:Asp23/Gls24 family envelope stress response protein [Gaiellaceae bacterium]
MTEDRPLVSSDVLARYAGDAALEVEGVAALADSSLHRRGAVEVSEGERPALTVRLELAWGSSAREVGAAVQRRVASYLQAMTGSAPAAVDVRFEAVGPPPPAE